VLALQYRFELWIVLSVQFRKIFIGIVDCYVSSVRVFPLQVLETINYQPPLLLGIYSVCYLPEIAAQRFDGAYVTFWYVTRMALYFV